MTLESVLVGPEAAFVAAARGEVPDTSYPEGRPHVVPISPVLDLERLIFASERDTQKVRNIEAGADVAIAFDEYHEDWEELRQVIVHGEAYVLVGGFEFERDRSLLYEKFPQYERQAPIDQATSVIVEVRVDRVVSWGLDG